MCKTFDAPVNTLYPRAVILRLKAIILRTGAEIVYFDTRGQNGRLARRKCKNAAWTRGRGRQAEVEGRGIFTRAVSESPVWPHVSNHIFLYKFMQTRVGSPFTDIENAP